MPTRTGGEATAKLPLLSLAKQSSERAGLAQVGPDLAKQSFKDECDINNIVARFTRTGVLDHVATRIAQYGQAPDLNFRDAMDIVVQGRETFDALPSNIRTRFGNDPGAFLDFVYDPENVEELRKLGLLPTEAPTIVPAPPAAPEEPTR